MGLLDGALGALLAGGAGGGAAGAIGSLAGGLLGGPTAGQPAQQGASPPDPMLAIALSVMQQHGGLGGCCGRCVHGGR